jgi:hypothetical protein
MNVDQFITSMANNANTIRLLTTGVADEQARWRPDSASWSILEVVNHLTDEEREDFRVRLDIILHQPEQRWSAIDPEGWVTDRQYNRRDLAHSLADFTQARDESLRWLKSLSSPNWQAAYEASFGRITAGDMFASWVTHDLHHMRQLIELQRAYTEHQIQPFRMDYAGPW